MTNPSREGMEKADKALRDNWCKDVASCGRLVGKGCEKCDENELNSVAIAIDKAVAEEREACAKIAEDYAHNFEPTDFDEDTEAAIEAGYDIAKGIRNRKESK